MKNSYTNTLPSSETFLHKKSNFLKNLTHKTSAYIFAFLFTNLFFTSSSFGQEAASATWALNSNFSSSVTGKVSADAMTYGAGINTYSISESLYTAPYSQSSLSEAIAGENYLQFTVSPADGLNFFITSVSFGGAVPLAHLEDAIIYTSVLFSTDPNFESYYTIGSANFNKYNIETTSFTVQNALIAVGNRHTGYIRIYGWNLTGNNYFNINNVVISGTTDAACTDPNTQATMLPFTETGYNGTTVNWSRGDGNRVIVVARLTSTVDVDPVNFYYYDYSYSPAHSAFGTGNTTGEGNYIVYIGPGTNVAVTNLRQATNYTFTVYEFNDFNRCYKTPGSSSSVSTLCPDPTITSFFPTSVCSGRESSLIIDGANYVSGGTSVTVNGISATPVNFINSNRITVPLPAEASGTGNITVTTCSTVTSGSTFTVNVPPTAPTGAVGAARCGTGSVTISASDPGSGLTVDWYAFPEGGPVLSGGRGTLSFTTPVITNTTTYFAETRNISSGCVSLERTAVIATINTTPTAGTISGPSSVCFGSNGVSYSVGAIANATSYTWAYSGAGATINGTTNPVTIDFASDATPGNLTVRRNNECGEGAVSVDFPITFFSGPPATGATICLGAASSPMIAECTGTVYWYMQSSGGTIVQTAYSFDPVGDPEVIAQGGIYANLTNTGTSGTYTFYADCAASPGCRTAVDFVILPVTEPDVTGFNMANAASPLLSGSPLTLTFYSPNIIDGTYTVIYNLTGANAAADVSASVEIVSHSGSFTISNLVNTGSTTITITSIKNTSGCSRSVTSNNSKDIVVGPPESWVTYFSSNFFYVPAGISSITVEAWGGGGKGGSAMNDPDAELAGGGGGGGAYSRSTFPAIPGTYSVIVGDGGTPDYATGGDSYIFYYSDGTKKVLAKGGAGVSGNNQDGASGGLASSGIGDTKFSGGSGANGNLTGNRGGGGGSSAGTGSDGNFGIGATGGTAPAGGGDGGNGSSGPGAGIAGSVPGGGGGGAYRATRETAFPGGNGAKGQVKITWLCPQATISYSSSYYYSSESPAAVTLTGSPGGTFSAIPGGLSINNLTGEINPFSSNTGIYTVHYQIPAAGDCAPVDATAEVTIVGPPKGPASVTYCASEEKTVIDLTSMMTGSGIKWYSSSTEGSQYTGTELLVTQSYFASQTIAGIESNTRTEVAVTVNPRPATPIVTTSIPPIICKGGAVILTSTESTGYLWSTDAVTRSISVGTTGSYWVKVTDSNGCQSLASIPVDVDADHEIPAEAVTPNPANAATEVSYAGGEAVTSVSWVAVPEATSYDVYFGEGSLPEEISSNVTENSYSVTLSADKTYYWKVVPRNNCGVAVSAATWTFTTKDASWNYCNGSAYAVIQENNKFPDYPMNGSNALGPVNGTVASLESSESLVLDLTGGRILLSGSTVLFKWHYVVTQNVNMPVVELQISTDGSTWTIMGDFTLSSFYTNNEQALVLSSDARYLKLTNKNYNSHIAAIDGFTYICESCNAPLITSHPSTATQTLCMAGSATELSVTANGTDLTYQWYSNATASNYGGSSIEGATSASYTPLTTIPGTLYYYCVVSNACPPFATSNVSGAVTVNPYPVITNPGNQVACVSYILPTINGSNLVAAKYYNNSQALGGTVITGPITSSQTVWIYDATETTPNCSDEESFTVTINPKPTLSGVTASAWGVCLGGSVDFTASGLLDGFTTFNYTLTFDGIDETPNVVNNVSVSKEVTGGVATFTIDAPALGTYFFEINSATLNGCTTNFGTINNHDYFAAEPQPSVVLVATDNVITICSGTETVLTAYPDGGVGINHISIQKLVGGDWIEIHESEEYYSIMVSPTETTTYRAVYSMDGNGCNDAISDELTITVNPVPSCSIAGEDGPVCVLRSLDYSAPEGMTTYKWSVTGNARIISSDEIRTITVRTGELDLPCGTPFTITLTVTDANGCNSTCTKTVEGTIPAAVEVTGPPSVSYKTCEFASQEVLNAVYQAWENQFRVVQAGCGGNTTDLNGFNPPDIVTGHTNVIDYTLSDGCTSDTHRAIFTVEPATEPAIDNITATANPICSNGETTLVANGVGGTEVTVTWYKGSISQETSLGTGSSKTVTGSGTYYAIVTGYCNPAEASITINEIPQSAVESVTGTSPLCVGSTDTYIANGVVSGKGTVKWFSSDATVATVSPSGLVSAIGAGTAEITCVIENGCNGNVSAFKTVTVNSAPTFTLQPENNLNVCAGGGTSTSFTATAAGTGTISYLWYKAGANPDGSDKEVSNGGPGFNTLTLSPVTTADAGYYYINATNDCGTTKSNVVQLTIENTPPQITCPDNITVNNNPGDCSAVVTYTAPVGTDNCPNPVTTQIAGLPSGSAFPVGVTTNRFMVTDGAGLTATCYFTVTVVDNQAPVISCPADLTNVTADPGKCSATINVAPPVVTDNCDNKVFLISNTELIKNGNFNEGVSSWQDCSNTAEVNTEEYYIVPLPPKSSNYVAEVDDEVSLCQNISGLKVGNKYVLTFKASRRQNTGTPNPVSANVIIDGGVLSKVVTRTNTTFGLTPESFEFTATQTTHKLTFMPSANNTKTLGLIVDDISIRSITYPVGLTTLEWTVTDVYGNTTACVQKITVTDNEAPVITDGADITQTADEGMCSVVVEVVPATATDNCGIQGSVAGTRSDAPLTLADPYPVGTTTITWSVSDIHGNPADPVTQLVIVTDNEEPVITCAQEIIQTADEGMCSAVVTVVPPVVTDNCDNNVLPISNTELIKNGNFNAGDSYWENCGNTAEVNTEEYYIVPLPPKSSNYVAEVDKGVSLCQEINGFVVGHKYVLTFKATRRQNVDTPNPVSANVIIDGGALSKVVTRTNATFDLTPETFVFTATQTTHQLTFTPSANNTSSLGFIVDDVSIRSITYPVGTTTLVWTATDVYGNTNTCEQNITVTDDEVPVITDGADITQTADEGMCSAVVEVVPTTATDNCGIQGSVAGTRSDAPLTLADPFPVGTTTITWTVSDVHGNPAAPVTQLVTVTDNEAPAVTCAQAITQTADAGKCSAAVSVVPPSVTDNCDNNVLPISNTELIKNGNFNEGDSYWENCGNTAEVKTEEFYIVPLPPPSSNYVAEVDKGVSLCQNISGLTVGHKYVLTFKATRRQNTDTPNPVSANVTIDGGALSKVVTRINTIFNLTPESFEFTATQATHKLTFTPSANNTSSLGFIVDDVSVRSITYPVGTTTLVWTATDVYGNTASCEQKITVTDNEAPTTICKDIEVTLGQDGTVSIEENEVNNGSFDNCTSLSDLKFDTDVIFFDCTKIGANNVEMRVTDEYSNSSTCKAVVTVLPYTVATEVSVLPDPQQYSDKATFTATVNPASVASGCVAATHVTFWVGTQQMGPAIALTNGTVSINYPLTELPSYPSNGQMAPGLHEVKAVFSGIDPAFIVPEAATTLTINPENVIIDYIGTEIVGEANPDVNTTPVTLRATITDNYMDDNDRGDIRNARVRFEIDGSPVSGWLVPTLVNQADLTQGIVSYVWNAPVPSSGYATYDITVNVGDNGYYNGSLDDVPVNVYRTSLKEFITGGGHIIPIDSKGEYASDPGRKVNFGFNVKWNKTMKNLQGNFNLILRRGSEIYQIKSNALSGLGVDGSNPCSHKAVLTAKANLNRVTGGITENIMGNLSLQVTLTDNGEPGVVDKIGVTLYNGSTMLYSSSWPMSSTEELTLVGGNILVNDGIICNASDITHTVIISSKNPSLTGEDVTFTATVYGHDAVPEGNLVFMINGETFVRTLDSKGSASVDYDFDDAGSYEVEANYTSTNSYKPSTGSITQLVNGTSFVLISSKNPSVDGDEVTLTAKLAGPETPTGSVTFRIDNSDFATVDLTGGEALISVSDLTVGYHLVTAIYTSTNDPLIVVDPASLTQVVNNVGISLASSKNPSALTEIVNFTATVTGSSSVGKTVNFFADGSTLPFGSDIVDASGNATVTTSFSTSGTHVITATLDGTSISASLNQVVQQPTLVLTSSKNPSAAGESVTFTATVTGGIGGNVTFTSGSTTVTQPLLVGVATWTTSFTAGSYLVTASYVGTFGSLTQVVNTIAPPLSVTLTASTTATSVVYGTNITFTATVNNSATAPSGTITFRDNNTILKVVTVSGGKASFSTNKLAVGLHSITATYDLTKTVSKETIILTVTAKTKSVEIVTAVEPEFSYADLKVYPNPFSEMLRFEFVSPVDVHARIQIFDVTGRMVKTVFDNPVQGGINYTAEFIPVSLITSMYFYRMTLGENVFVGKVIYKK